MTMYLFGELLVSGLIFLSAYGLIYAADFNENVLNKKESDGTKNRTK
jgi:hypothetical protein